MTLQSLSNLQFGQTLALAEQDIQKDEAKPIDAQAVAQLLICERFILRAEHRPLGGPEAIAKEQALPGHLQGQQKSFAFVVHIDLRLRKMASASRNNQRQPTVRSRWLLCSLLRSNDSLEPFSTSIDYFRCLRKRPVCILL